jgi:Rrf2 family nitric oxide-sensitive transcriptional repressor
MRLALQTDYALRSLIYLAFVGRRATADQIAGFYGISTHHVAKVVQQLARWGYVRGIRGLGGGFELARPPGQITIGEIVAASEGNTHLLECVDVDDVCRIQSFCKLRGVLAEAERIQTEYLQSVTLEDVLPKKAKMRSVAAQAT